MKTKKIGRPRKPDKLKQRFVNLHVYPETQAMIRKQAKHHGMTICDYVQDLVKGGLR